MATYLLLGYAIGAGALLPRTPCERTVCNYVGARNLFVLYHDTVIGTFSMDLFVHRLWRMLVHTQVKPLCACMLACLRIAFYDVYTAPFF